MKFICLRYGIPIEFYNDLFFNNHKEDFNTIKKILIKSWSNNISPIKEKCDNIFVNCLYKLEDTERIIFNMYVVDDYSLLEISNLLKIDYVKIEEKYNKAKKRMQEYVYTIRL